MAYVYRRKDGRVEIRESQATPRGPRSRTLVSFREALTPSLLDRAEAAARRPLDRAKLRKRAEELGIRIAPDRADAAARELIGLLRRGSVLDPGLASVLAQYLDAVEVAPLPDDLIDVAEWIGASESERARALRDVLRLYDTIARSPDAAPAGPPARLPRIPRTARRAAS